MIESYFSIWYNKSIDVPALKRIVLMQQIYENNQEFNELSQKIAEAIEAVTKIDVTIMDYNRKRIAATGRYQDPSFGGIGENSAFSICLKTGKVCIIEETGKSKICNECSCLESCVEKAEICVPITWKDKPIGVIGLIAFDAEQQKTILDNCHAYVNFVQKMASLLEGKYGEIMALEENRRLTQKMKNIINSTKRQKYLIMLDDADELKQELIKAADARCDITFNSILGISRAMKEVKEMAKSIASTESPVMIRGESGTGKELFARAIHYSSSRRTKPFIPINCGAIPDNLLESELFGYEKGAFTGANASKPGKFEIADGGTVFLDEIGELPPRLQVKLLRIIQEKEICRLGSNTTRRINVRILSATNADLEQRIRDGLFREDLYYRLNIFPIHIPPLREHKEDIEYLANYFLHYYNGQFEKEIKGLSEEVRKMFLSYTWPGNVRELQSVMEFAVCLETKDLLSGPLIHRRLNREINMGFRAESAAEYSLKGEKQVFLSLIKKYRDLSYKDMEKSICAELGISRATYYRKKKKYQAE